jgi:hypothetical protein
VLAGTLALADQLRSQDTITCKNCGDAKERLQLNLTLKLKSPTAQFNDFRELHMDY